MTAVLEKKEEKTPDQKVEKEELKTSNVELKVSNNRVAPERKTVLQSETHKVKLDAGDGVKNSYITVSFFEGTNKPYEVFIHTPFGNSLKDIQILESSARMTSLSLRHGVHVKYVVEQLQKISGQYIYSIPAVLAKVLSNYINDNSNIVFDYNSFSSNNDSDEEISEDLSDEELDRLIAGEEKTTSSKIKGSKCPKCGEMAYIVQEGCGQCMSCSYSKCS
jgi:ribonucleoside-diphosphate reductase alpha chain